MDIVRRLWTMLVLFFAFAFWAYSPFWLALTDNAPHVHSELLETHEREIDLHSEDTGQNLPERHCHPGYDCLLIAVLVPNPVRITLVEERSIRWDIQPDSFASISLSAQGPPPRRTIGPERRL